MNLLEYLSNIEATMTRSDEPGSAGDLKATAGRGLEAAPLYGSGLMPHGAAQDYLGHVVVRYLPTFLASRL